MTKSNSKSCIIALTALAATLMAHEAKSQCFVETYDDYGCDTGWAQPVYTVATPGWGGQPVMHQGGCGDFYQGGMPSGRYVGGPMDGRTFYGEGQMAPRMNRGGRNCGGFGPGMGMPRGGRNCGGFGPGMGMNRGGRNCGGFGPGMGMNRGGRNCGGFGPGMGMNHGGRNGGFRGGFGPGMGMNRGGRNCGGMKMRHNGGCGPRGNVPRMNRGCGPRGGRGHGRGF